MNDPLEWPQAQFPEFTPEDGASAEADNPSEALIACWRCGKWGSAAQALCRYCRAPLVRDSSPLRSRRGEQTSSHSAPIVRMVLVFMGILLVSLVFGMLQHFGLNANAGNDVEALRRQLYWTVSVEMIHTALIVMGLVWVGRLPPAPSQPLPLRVAVWVSALPILVGLLALNYTYSRLLTDFLHLPAGETGLLSHKELIGWVLLTFCVQPAVVEELFFRYLALGALRGITKTRGAILISSIMFGMAHIYNPLGIPVLIVIGVVLGYVRVVSGSLLLPILMHFGHNLVVLLIN